MPGKTGDGKAQPQIVFDQPFEDFISHPLSALTDLRGAAFIEAVLAIDIAVRAGWFYEQ